MLRGTWFAPLLVVALTLSPAAADETGPTPAQKMAIYAKPSVVRVVAIWEGTFRLGGRDFKVLDGGHGSGFFVSDDGFIATNAHVVHDIHEGEAAARRKLGEQALPRMVQAFPELRRRDDAQQLLIEAISNGRIVKRAEVVLPDGTKLPYEIKAYGAPVGEGKDVAIIKVETKDAPNLVIGDSDKMTVQDPIIALGYPGAADLEGLLDTKSQLEASITDGTVAAIKRTNDGEPVLQVTATIGPGNSGGPAINLKGEVIGLVTFQSRAAAGFNFLVAASTVKQFVKEAKAGTKPSKTQTMWRKALDEHWAGSYDDAIVDFEETVTLFPAHSEAPRMIKQARAFKKEGKGKKKEDDGGGNGGAIAGVIIAVLLVGIVGTVIAVKKKKPAAHPHASYPPMGPPPMGPPMGAQPMMMGGRVGPAPGIQPVAKTMAIGGAGNSGHAPVAATAFGSLTIGSLTCTRGLLQGQRFSLQATGLLIGRQPGQAQVVVNDSRASGKHVWIGYENGVLVAIDQGTTNGTFVNDVRLGRISKAPLKDGDTVIVAEPDCLSLTLKLS